MSKYFDPRELAVKLVENNLRLSCKYKPTPSGGILEAIHEDAKIKAKLQERIDEYLELILEKERFDEDDDYMYSELQETD